MTIPMSLRLQLPEGTYQNLAGHVGAVLCIQLSSVCFLHSVCKMPVVHVSMDNWYAKA